MQFSVNDEVSSACFHHKGVSPRHTIKVYRNKILASDAIRYSQNNLYKYIMIYKKLPTEIFMINVLSKSARKSHLVNYTAMIIPPDRLIC